MRASKSERERVPTIHWRKVKCKSCGNEFLDDALFCRKCGTKRDDVVEVRLIVAAVVVVVVVVVVVRIGGRVYGAGLTTSSQVPNFQRITLFSFTYTNPKLKLETSVAGAVA